MKIIIAPVIHLDSIQAGWGKTTVAVDRHTDILDTWTSERAESSISWI